jgi:hypothetical protein
MDDCGVCFGDNSTCYGCTDADAYNFDGDALFDDGGCNYLGDFNNDDSVDVTDIIQFIELYLAEGIPTAYQLESCDLFADGNLDVIDMVQIIQIILNSAVVRTDPVGSAQLQLSGQDLDLVTDGQVAAIELWTTGDYRITRQTLPEGWLLVRNESRVVMLDVSGQSRLNDHLFQFAGDLNIIDSRVIDWNGSSLSAELVTMPGAFELMPAYPNPFNPVTTIEFGMMKEVQVHVAIYDLLGREVAVLVNGIMPAGVHQINWDASSFTSGLYLVKMQTGDFTSVRKVILMR